MTCLSCVLECAAGGGEGAYADVDVVALGEEPAVAAGEGGEVEDEVVGCVAAGEGCGERGVGDGGFECEAVVVARRASPWLS